MQLNNACRQNYTRAYTSAAMRAALFLLVFGATTGVAASGPIRPVASHPATPAAEAETALVKQYCVVCHNQKLKTGGLSLAAFDAIHAEDDVAVAEKMIRKLRAGMMPPAGARRPDAAALASLAEALEMRVDAAAAAHPNPGWRSFQRLNRAEYGRAVRDLLALDVDVAAFLPPDTISSGFDNLADAQGFSPALMEGYLRTAGRVAALAVGDVDATASEATFKLPKTRSQVERAEGAPLGTRGGVSVVHTFPADGEYVFRMDMYAEPLGLLFGSTARGEQIEVSIDGARVALFDIDPRMSEEKTGLSIKTEPVYVKAGARRVTAAFVKRFDGPINDLIAPIDHTLADTEIGVAYGITTLPHLRSLSIVGPHRVTGVSDTASRRQIFTCRPTGQAEERPCAESIVRTLATRAFRRPVAENDLERLMAFYDSGRSERNFEYGVLAALEAVLASPQFLFRLEPAPASGRPGEPYRLADIDLASRLSFFLWGSGPDPGLLKLATENRLSTPGGLSREVSRMLADRRSEALATRFGSQWLRLQDLEKVFPDPILYPYYDYTLADAFKRETELFFESLVREDRSVLELLTADYTFANERVARHYGIPNVMGSAFRRVTLPAHRRGILGHGSVLTLTSISDRTSPVMRGKWVMEVLLGSPPPPPPPNVPTLDQTKAEQSGKLLSVRQRMEEHRKNPACNSCHRMIDPIGLALENFDATGKWRIRDGESAVDASGDLYDGTKLDGPEGLRDALLKQQDAVLLSFTESLMTYALGRRIEPRDMPAVRKIIRDAAKQDYRMSAFVQGVVDSPAFKMSAAPAAESTARR
jgi:cytochrome c551/c552